MDKKEIQSVWNAFQEVQEKKKAPVTNKDDDGEGMDPVGKEDGDIDNDGDKDSSDEYLKNRRKKVGKEVEKDKDVKESEESPYPSLDKKKREKKGSNLEDAGGPAAKLKGESVEAKKVECPKCEGKGCDHCDDKGYHMKEDYESFVESLDEEELDEYLDWLQLDEIGVVGAVAGAGIAARAAGKAAGHVMKRRGETRLAKKIASAHSQNNSSAPKKEAFEIISQVLEARQTARLESVLSPAELAAIEEKMGPGATGGAPEKMGQTLSAGEKKFATDHKKSDKKFEDMEDKSEKDASDAGKAVKSQSPPRRGEKRIGDNAMPTPTKAKGQ